MTADYYPLKRGQKRRFRSRAPGAPPVEYTLETVDDTGVPGGSTTGTIRDTVHAQPPRASEFEAKIINGAVFEDGVQVLTYPPKVGDSWDAEERAYEVVSLDEVVATPAGMFPSCAKVQYLIAGGDAGSGARYYAPGLGLVKEECADEADPFVAELIAKG